ncbi:MAG: site-2 protease family protein [Nocardioides sp.]
MSESGSRLTERAPGTIKIGQMGDAEVLVSRSWFLIAALIAVLIAPRAEAVQPGLGNWKYVAGLAFAVVLYASVFLHEAAHAYAARRLGFPVSSITLHFLGGMTAIEGEARRPRQEFVIAVVGPIASLVVGVVGLGLASLTEGGLLRLVLGGVAYSNLIIGVLNLVPGLPLDGGRVLKAAVWRATGNVHQATLVAGWCGRLLAIVVLLWPLLQAVVFDNEPSVYNVLMSAIIAAFLWSGATAAMTSARLRRRLPTLIARHLVRPTLVVPDDLPLAEALRRAGEAGATALVTASADGTPIGIVHDRAVDATPDERRPWLPVASVTKTLVPGLTLPAELRGEELILAISRQPAPEYLLTESGGEVLGVLVSADVDRAFRESRQ